MANITALASGLKLVGGIVIGEGVKSVIGKHLGYTVNLAEKPIEKAITAIGVWGIGYGVADMVCDSVDKAIDGVADAVIAVQDKMAEIRANAEGTALAEEDAHDEG